jgi:hypothetical protein
LVTAIDGQSQADCDQQDRLKSPPSVSIFLVHGVGRGGHQDSSTNAGREMDRSEHGADGAPAARVPSRRSLAIGRSLALAVIAAGAAYLAWRIGWSWRSDSSVVWWLALPAIAIEVTGFGGFVLLVWALWRPPTALDAPAPADDIDCTVVVNARADAPDDLRATLVALRADPTVTAVIVVNHTSVAAVDDVAAEFGVPARAGGAADPSGLAAAVDVGGEWVLLLDAGDIPLPGAAWLLADHVTDSSVAAVQGMVAAHAGDSAEHGPSGRHDLFFERRALDPALGARGTAFLTGSASLVRLAALERIELPAGNQHDVLWTLTSRFAGLGLRVVAPAGRPVVTCRPVNSAGAVADDRGRRASAAWRLVAGPDGAFRAIGLGVRQRAGLLSWAVRPLDGLRRVVLGAVVLSALLAGRTPFVPTAAAVVGLWLPSFVLGAVALTMLSGGSLRPGDRLRNAVRSYRIALALAVAINSILVVRGISDRFTHALHPMHQSVQIGLILVSLWLLAGCLDSMRLLARRRRHRRVPRLVAATAGTLGDLDVHVADVTMLGAGLVCPEPPRIGSVHQLRFTLRGNGLEATDADLELTAVVRNCHVDVSGSARVGVEFTAAEGAALDALAQRCVVWPALVSLGAIAVPDTDASTTTPLDLGFDDHDPRQFALRVATLFALAAVVSSAAAVGASAAPPSVHRVSGFVSIATATTATDATGDSLVIDATDPSTVVITLDPNEVPETTLDTTPTDSTTIDTIASAPDATVITATGSSTLAPGSTSNLPDVTNSSLVEAPESPADTSPSTGDLGGLNVIAVCSEDPGADGIYGTADDVYGPTVSTVTGPHGHYELAVDGDACWLSIAPPAPPSATGDEPTVATGFPPVPAIVVDVGTPADAVVMSTIMIERAPIETPVSPTASVGQRNASVGDRVWSDLDADGVQQPGEPGIGAATVMLYDETGRVATSQQTAPDGSFLFEAVAAGRYRLGVSNVPASLRVPAADPLRSTGELFTVVAGEHLATADIGLVSVAGDVASTHVGSPLPTPAADAVRTQPDGGSSTGWGTLLVILVAALLAGSVLVASRDRSATRALPPTWR